MRRSLPRVAVITGLVGLISCASAYAIKIEVGGTTISATASLLPRVLPAHQDAPVTLSSVTRIKAKETTTPPILEQMKFLFDKHGSIDTKGIPVCTMAKLAETTPAEARKRCAGALVGTGTGRAKVGMPGQPPVEISSPLSFFNAPPAGGKPSLIAHAYETIPVAKTLLVPIAIEKVKHGRYGFQAKIQLPEIAAGHGSPTLAEATIGRTFGRGGKSVGYIAAHCAGGRLQVHGALSFSNGDFFPATLTSPCHSPG
jgi:hypothetical protein